MAHLARAILKQRLASKLKDTPASIIPNTNQPQTKTKSPETKKSNDGTFDNFTDDFDKLFEGDFDDVFGQPLGSSSSVELLSDEVVNNEVDNVDKSPREVIQTEFGPEGPPPIMKPIRQSQQRIIDPVLLQSLTKGKFVPLLNTNGHKDTLVDKSSEEDKIALKLNGLFSTNPITLKTEQKELSLTNPNISFNQSPAVEAALTRGPVGLPGKRFQPITKPYQIRGLYTEFFNLGQRPKDSHVATKYFECEYFPPNHIRAYYRKSKVSLVVFFRDGFNQNDPTSTLRKNIFPNSCVPRDSGAFRSKWRKMIRLKFLEALKEVGDIDGLFTFHVELYPTKPEEKEIFQHDLKKTLEYYKSQDYSDQIKQINSNARINWILRGLAQSGLRTYAVPPYLEIPGTLRHRFSNVPEPGTIESK